MRNPYTNSHAQKNGFLRETGEQTRQTRKTAQEGGAMFPQGACIAKKMIRETLLMGKNALAEKISYRKAQLVIATATFMAVAMPQMTFASSGAETGKSILTNIITNVFGPLGKIVGGFMVVGGIFKYLMAQKDEDARGQHGAVMAIAVGALLFGASTILSNVGIADLIA